MKNIFIIEIVVFLLILFLTPFLFVPTRPPNYLVPESNKTKFGGKTAEELNAEGK